uniref:Uncharacterized protein n=1 Tax=Arundo donax TaxID=35708 RepID=A0A0A9GY81_ARUDO
MTIIPSPHEKIAGIRKLMYLVYTLIAV